MNSGNEPEFDGRSGQGKRLYWAAIVALMLGITALYHAVLRNDGGMKTLTGSDGRVMIVLDRQRNGHFAAEGKINGGTVNFLVDTGATDVAISENFARARGLEFGPRIGIMTAAGRIGGWMTRLDSVEVGDLELRNVRATISPGLGEEALLGMSFLKNYSIVQEGDTLVISSPL